MSHAPPSISFSPSLRLSDGSSSAGWSLPGSSGSPDAFCPAGIAGWSAGACDLAASGRCGACGGRPRSIAVVHAASAASAPFVAGWREASLRFDRLLLVGFLVGGGERADIRLVFREVATHLLGAVAFLQHGDHGFVAMLDGDFPEVVMDAGRVVVAFRAMAS